MKDDNVDYSNDILSGKDVNERCEKHITSRYTTGKQLTVERVGTDTEKASMYQFIDACRAWANSAHPKLHGLYVIKPQ